LEVFLGPKGSPVKAQTCDLQVAFPYFPFVLKQFFYVFYVWSTHRRFTLGRGSAAGSISWKTSLEGIQVSA